jgi:hypothetical protein
LVVFGIYYGSWAANDYHIKHTRDLVNNIGSTVYWSTVALYTDSFGAPATSQLAWGGQTFINASTSEYGYIWTIDNVLNIVNGVIDTGVFAVEVAALSATQTPFYYVFTSKDVSVPGFCTTQCSYHNFQGAMLYGWVGNPEACPANHVTPVQQSSCSYITPQLLDTAAATVHELVETITDPYSDGYMNNASSFEVMDYCEWKVVDRFTGSAHSGYLSATNGNFWDVNVSGDLFFLEPIWDPFHGGVCTIQGEEPYVAGPPAGLSSATTGATSRRTKQPGGLPVWLWVLLATLPVLLCVLVYMVHRRHRSHP